MPFWCIDSTNGDDVSGAVQVTQAAAELTPYKTLAAIEVEASPPAAGDFILFNGGDLALGIHTLDIGTDGTSGNPITFGSYGTGHGGIDADGGISAIDTNSNEYLTFDNLELKGGKTNILNGKVMVVNGGNTVDKNIIIQSCHLHDPEPSEVSGEGHGLRINAANTKVIDTEINSTSDDGIYCEGDNTEIFYCYIHDVDKSVAVRSGDCVKFSGAAACTNSHVHHCILDHSANNRKSAAIIQGSGTGQICEHNKCIGGAINILSGGLGNIIRRNLCHPHKLGLYGASTDNVTRTDGINIEDGDGTVIESNIVDSQALFTPTYLLYATGSLGSMNNLVIQGNVFYGPLVTSGQTLKPAAGTGHTIRNNIIGGSQMDGAVGTFHINAGNTVTFTECNYNIYIGDGGFKYNGIIYTTFDLWKAAGLFDQNSTHLTQAQAEDLFIDPANGDFRIKEGQEVLGAQVGYSDFMGNRNFPTIIGAYSQPLTNTSGSLTSDAGTVDTTLGTIAGSITGGNVVVTGKYPNWGIRTQ